MGKPLPPIMGDSKKSTTPTSEPSSSPPSAPAPAGNSSGMKIPSASSGNLLLGTGGLLLLRMLVFGWVLSPLEAIVVVIVSGFAHYKGDAGQKKLAKWFIGLGLVQFFAPTAIAWVQNLHQAQFNPPAPVEELAPPAEEVPLPSTERVVVSGKKITLTGDGTYSNIPKGRKSLCFSHWGLKDGSTNVPQQISVNGEIFNALGKECFPLDETLSDTIIVDFFPNLDYGAPKKVKDMYNYWKSQPGGQAEWPIIRIGE